MDFSSKPEGGKITIKKGLDDSFEFSIPKKGFTLSLVPLFFLTLLLFLALGYFTLLLLFSFLDTHQDSLRVLMIISPFWVLEIYFFIIILNAIFETQILIVNNKSLTFKKLKVFKLESKEFNFNTIQSITLNRLLDFKLLIPAFVFSLLGLCSILFNDLSIRELTIFIAFLLSILFIMIRKKTVNIFVSDVLKINTNSINMPLFETIHKEEQAWLLEVLNRHIYTQYTQKNIDKSS